MIPVTSALLVPEPGGVHELVDHDARVNAARSQGNLQQIAQTLILSSMEVSGARTCCLLPHLPTELLHPLPFMMWMKSFCLTRGTNWKEITFLQVDTSFNWLENLICAAVLTPCAYYGTGTTLISTFQVNKKCVPSPKRIVVQVGENTTGWQWWLVTWVGLTMLLVIPLTARFLPRQMGVWQNWLGNWERWQNIPNRGQPNPCHRPPLPPCNVSKSNDTCPYAGVLFVLSHGLRYDGALFGVEGVGDGVRDHAARPPGALCDVVQ